MTQATLQDALGLINSGRTEDGVQLLRQVASSGDPQALFVLADMTWAGGLVDQDPARAIAVRIYGGARPWRGKYPCDQSVGQWHCRKNATGRLR